MYTPDEVDSIHFGKGLMVHFSSIVRLTSPKRKQGPPSPSLTLRADMETTSSNAANYGIAPRPSGKVTTSTGIIRRMGHRHGVQAQRGNGASRLVFPDAPE